MASSIAARKQPSDQRGSQAVKDFLLVKTIQECINSDGKAYRFADRDPDSDSDQTQMPLDIWLMHAVKAFLDTHSDGRASWIQPAVRATFELIGVADLTGENSPHRGLVRDCLYHIQMAKQAGEEADEYDIAFLTTLRYWERFFVEFENLPGLVHRKLGTKSKAAPPREPVQTVFGYVEGVNIGATWLQRAEVTKSGVHCRPQGSVHGRKAEGVFSIIIAGGYSEDNNKGFQVTFTGVGKGGCNAGQVGIGSKLSIDQLTEELNINGTENCSLIKSIETGNPVRLVVSHDTNLTFRPDDGFRFSGLWVVKEHIFEVNANEVRVLRFNLIPFDDATRVFVLNNYNPPVTPDPSNSGTSKSKKSGPSKSKKTS